MCASRAIVNTSSIASSSRLPSLRMWEMYMPPEADATFACTATDRRGRSVEIVVTNNEDTFEWQTGPLSTLGGRR